MSRAGTALSSHEMRHYGAGESRPTRRLVSALRSRPASRLRSRTSAWLLTLAAVAVWLGAAAPGAFAAPDITLDKQAPRAVLLGEDSPVTLHVTNPTGQPYGYNLSFRDVLPAGVSYVPGSALVAPRILPNAPAAGQTTLIFENVSDLSPGSAYDLGYQVRHDPAVLGVGDAYTNQAGAYINTDPRFVPDFGANGAPSGDFTGSATDDATTAINAIEIEKDEPSPEGELLRGVHDHQTVYTLTVRNNEVEPTTGIHVEDWLPAGLEFLGCGTDDNTTNAPTNPAGSPDEYAGSGLLNPGNAPATTDCVAPDLVETVLTDPDGADPLPTAVYTHVVWNDLGTIAPGAQIKIQYVAGIPLRENTTTWAGPFPPTPASAPPANAAAADDPSFVTTGAVGMTKTRTTAVNEAGNNLASQATVGERIDYTVTFVIPEGTTLYGTPQLTDNLGTRHGPVTNGNLTFNGGLRRPRAVTGPRRPIAPSPGPRARSARASAAASSRRGTARSASTAASPGAACSPTPHSPRAGSR